MGINIEDDDIIFPMKWIGYFLHKWILSEMPCFVAWLYFVRLKYSIKKKFLKREDGITSRQCNDF